MHPGSTYSYGEREEKKNVIAWGSFVPLLSIAVTIITEMMLSICYKYTYWPASMNLAPLPECYTKVPLFSSQGEILTLPTCEWLQKRRNQHIPSLRLAKRKVFCKNYGLFTLLPHLLPLSFL